MIGVVTRFARRLVRALTLGAGTYGATASGQRAAAISYRVLFSLVPFVALFVSVAELFLPETAQERLSAWLVGALPIPDDLRDSVEDAVAEADPPASLAGVVSLLGLLWAASGMMASVRSAFRAIWRSDAPRPYLRGKLLDFGLVLVAGIVVVAAFGIGVAVQIVTHASTRVVTELGGDGDTGTALGGVAELAGSLALTVAAFILLYRIVPPVPVRLRDVLPAAVIAAVGFHVASAGFSVYLRHFADFDEVYGPLGAVFGFLLLVYVGAVVLLLGACVAAAWPAAEHPPEPVGGERGPLGRRLADAALGLVVHRRRR